MQHTILRSEVINTMDTGQPFTMEFVKCDRKRGTGGELVKVEGWQKMKGEAAGEVSPGDHPKRGSGSRPRPIKVVNILNPHSRLHHPIGVHVMLMLTFNGKRILNG